MPCKKIDGANIGEWTQDYDAAVALAKEKGSNLILNFTGSDWCGWCKLMDSSVFHHKDFPGKAADLNLVLVYIDFPQDKTLVPEKYKARNKTLSEQYGVGGYPTYIVLDTKLNKIGKLGAGRGKTPESFSNEIKAVLRTTESALENKAKELGDKGQEFKDSYQAIKTAEKELADWIETKPQQNEANMKLFNGHNEKIAAAQKKFDSYFD